jgi:hypothetical protein
MPGVAWLIRRPASRRSSSARRWRPVSSAVPRSARLC